MPKADSVHSTPPTNASAIAVVTIPRFETLQDAEDALMKQGFRLVPNTCNWIDADGGIDAGIYPVEDDAYGVTKFRIQYRHQVAAPVDPTRRHFLSQAAGLAASATALTMASRSAVPEIDPAFTLIAEKRAADIVHGKAIDTLTAESQLPPVDSTRR